MAFDLKGYSINEEETQLNVTDQYNITHIRLRYNQDINPSNKLRYMEWITLKLTQHVE